MFAEHRDEKLAKPSVRLGGGCPCSLESCKKAIIVPLFVDKLRYLRFGNFFQRPDLVLVRKRIHERVGDQPSIRRFLTRGVRLVVVVKSIQVIDHAINDVRIVFQKVDFTRFSFLQFTHELSKGKYADLIGGVNKEYLEVVLTCFFKEPRPQTHNKSMSFPFTSSTANEEVRILRGLFNAATR